GKGAALAVRADVSSAADLTAWHAETVSRLGRPDILVTNTGGPARRPLPPAHRGPVATGRGVHLDERGPPQPAGHPLHARAAVGADRPPHLVRGQGAGGPAHRLQ